MSDGSLSSSTAEETDPLVTLRERYARGELSDETFERKLERLLETETYEGARDSLRRPSRAPRERSRELERYRGKLRK
ncbi:SHOCT domain-containing protein [Haloprofundus halobius]|uniref:SHOCT domain-containing protein n=1 Tax=Haloprofundus halobius TaxID=2876194 RepID=UPI003CCDB039